MIVNYKLKDLKLDYDYSDAQEYLHIFLDYIYQIDYYAKTSIDISYYHGVYVNIIWKENDEDILLMGWSSENIDEAIYDLLDNFILEKYNLQWNPNNYE